MATYQILCWRDLPAQIRVKDGKQRTSVQLDNKFQEKIDRVAMELGLFGTDEYLEQFKWGEKIEREGSAQEVAEAVKQELEAQFKA